MASRQKLRILCFGDSLTAGYSSMGAIYHTYETMLVQFLEMAFPELDVETVEDGVPGSVVKYDFKSRMEEHFDPDTKGNNGYDWAIVLGGTNDIAMGIPGEDVFTELKKVWDMPLRRNVKVLALTVPEAGMGNSPAIIARRKALNDSIKGYKRTNFHAFDLHAAIPYFAMSAEDRRRYWDDAIHFTPDGYDFIGNKVGIYLVSILAREKAENDPSPAKRRRWFKDDEKVFDEEENESPKAIDRGYVVVRRRDLD
ncbi:SGNH hydrolase-type esterase domain-containing protein [Apodospora peruviana]|uniref:SGNH hydrolase-type esterase domain-containing protein n=1 Tax=Apodospora peruviana TaxID=516989 RepID=A0AAE0IT25_9PEZI|nr:SGNH hydrolase-type esterase domain-containing protein [Apodospora peruviana]